MNTPDADIIFNFSQDQKFFAEKSRKWVTFTRLEQRA